MKKKLFIASMAIALIAVSRATLVSKINLPAPSDSCQCAFVNVHFGPKVPGDLMFFGSQQNPDCFAWAEFISLNWPTSGKPFGTPRDYSPVQWETYIAKEALFPPNGQAPPPWGNIVPPMYAAKIRASHLPVNQKVLRFSSKFEDFDSARFDSNNINQAAPFHGPAWLGAQNGTNVWYEVRLNHDIYKFIVDNKYYNAENQELAVRSGKPIIFPEGVAGTDTVGAIELKAAWMEVKNSDTANKKWSRYKLSRATVVDPTTGKSHSSVVALVGLHILHKTRNQRTWVWATFEQVDNVPGSPVTNGDYSFYNSNCSPQTFDVPKQFLAPKATSPVTVSCADTSPPYYLGIGGPAPRPIQLQRYTSIDATAATINATMQNQVKQFFPNSVWQYYQLVNVIWSSSPAPDPTAPIKVPAPTPSMLPPTSVSVANITMESYAQKTQCIDCHKHASIAPTPDNPKPDTSGDFSFALGDASYPRLLKLNKRKTNALKK